MSLRAFLCSMLFISACAKAGEPEAETDWASAARKRMVDKIADYSPRYRVEDPRVLDAMRRVPRHEFVPKEIADYAYADRPLPIGEKQTISQPFIVGYMTAALNLKPQHKVLEIGTGSGYQAAILGELAGAVYSIEI
ncbi:MAG: protein-L-isoaspartate(D-aspartate) O-methyltransferase, partial [Elusimicrobiota bacterium]